MRLHLMPIITKRMVIGLPSIALIVLSMQGCTTSSRDHYVTLTHSVLEEGAPEHDEVALAFGLPLYQPNQSEVESVLVEVLTTNEP